ncbi:MAG: hypothetical protein JST47_09575 [Bacteroidetes bacterium]|nr:hypothetical protein [Bacteroidota bacterium]
MRKITFAIILLPAFGLFNHLYAQDYKVAIGIRLSSAAPTLSNSVSIKYFMNDRNALEGLVSFGPTRFGVGGLFEMHQLIGNVPAFTWFYGGGGYVGFQSGNTYLGPTGIIGLDYKFQNAPINLSLDWKPELDILPAINFVPDAFAVTARFTFK